MTSWAAAIRRTLATLGPSSGSARGGELVRAVEVVAGRGELRRDDQIHVAFDARDQPFEPIEVALDVAEHRLALLSPRRIVLGGGVLGLPGLVDQVCRETRELLAGALTSPLLDGDLADYIVPAGLGDRAGPLGALVLAEDVPVV